MGCRLPYADSIDDLRPRPRAVRPLVLLAIDDDEVRARFAYELAACGFDIVVDGAGDLPNLDRPAVIVTNMSAAADSDAGRVRGIPVVAIADDVNESTRDLARQEGCAAVCLITCSGAALAAGIRVVLGRR